MSASTSPARSRIRPSADLWVTLLAVAALILGVATIPRAAPASAASTYDQKVAITFPVAGPTSYIDDYDARRGTDRRHRATDIMAPYGAKVHAAMGGTITFITGLTSAPPSYGYMITISGDDGRRYNYIHLGRQDRGPGEAYAAGMRRGVRVERGQHIGYSGCSGNASCSAPHLHFEIEDAGITDPYGTNRMNPYPSLKDAERRGDTPEAGLHRTSTCPGKAYALAGDWDRSGRAGVGWWCDGRVRLRTSGGQVLEYTYGRAGDLPLAGDFNGDGRTTIGIVRDRTWHLKNSHRGGASDVSFVYGRVTRGDVPIVGDWNGNGQQTPGIIRDGEWHLRNSLSGGSGQIVFIYGRILRGDQPLIGNWNGNARDGIGIVRGGEWHLRNSLSGGPAQITFIYGRVTSGDQPVMGDWTGDGRSTPGIARGREWHLRHQLAGGGADRVISFPAP